MAITRMLKRVNFVPAKSFLSNRAWEGCWKRFLLSSGRDRNEMPHR